VAIFIRSMQGMRRLFGLGICRQGQEVGEILMPRIKDAHAGMPAGLKSETLATWAKVTCNLRGGFRLG